jgi:hypothetical protein
MHCMTKASAQVRITFGILLWWLPSRMPYKPVGVISWRCHSACSWRWWASLPASNKNVRQLTCRQSRLSNGSGRHLSKCQAYLDAMVAGDELRTYPTCGYTCSVVISLVRHQYAIQRGDHVYLERTQCQDRLASKGALGSPSPSPSPKAFPTPTCRRLMVSEVTSAQHLSW